MAEACSDLECVVTDQFREVTFPFIDVAVVIRKIAVTAAGKPGHRDDGDLAGNRPQIVANKFLVEPGSGYLVCEHRGGFIILPDVANRKLQSCRGSECMKVAHTPIL